MAETFTIVIQKWEESEAGWGIRPDGWTMHLTAADHAAYMKRHSDEQKADYARTKTVPAEYSRPSGSAYPMDVDLATYEKLKAAQNHSMWGEGNMPPKGKQGTYGFVTVKS
jgi:hypothetical protein